MSFPHSATVPMSAAAACRPTRCHGALPGDWFAETKARCIAGRNTSSKQ